MNEIRLLRADEIECRVQSCGKYAGKNTGWCILLLYKDARCDQRILDETFGMFGWKRRHETINGQLCCTVSVKDPSTGEWVDKQDVGTESNTEAVKGQFSDSFKRASFNWGVGRELYTAPTIVINNLSDGELVERNGKVQVSPKCVFTVAEIGYDNNKNIIALTIVDKNGATRYKMGATRQAVPQGGVDELSEQLNGYALPSIKQAQSRDECERIWNDFPALQKDQRFIDAINERLARVAA